MNRRPIAAWAAYGAAEGLVAPAPPRLVPGDEPADARDTATPVSEAAALASGRSR